MRKKKKKKPQTKKKEGKKKKKTKEDGTKDINSTLYQNYHFDVVKQKKGIPRKKTYRK